MSFNFDPFAPSAPPAKAPPAAAPSAETTGNNHTASAHQPSRSTAAMTTVTSPPPGASVIVNPFGSFGITQRPANTNGGSDTTGASHDWQQSARAAMSSRTGVWKSLGAGLSKNPPAASLQSTPGGRPGGSNRAPRLAPYVSPFSTLESNWSPWLHAAAQLTSASRSSLWSDGGNFATYLIVRANDACCATPVESVLKWSKQRNGSGSMMGVEAELTGNGHSSNVFDSSLSLSESQNEDGPSEISYGNLGTSLEHSNSLRSSTSVSSGGMGGSMRFLKSGLKKAQASLERSVTTMAIIGNKNPDQLCVSLHYLGGLNAANHGGDGATGVANGTNSVNLAMMNALGTQDVGDVCLSRTEWVDLPSRSSGEEALGEGLLFSMPLCLPDLRFLEAASSSGCGVRLTVRLHLRSSAALLKAVKREYCIGESALLYSNVMQLLQSPPPSPSTPETHRDNGEIQCGTINIPFISGMLAETTACGVGIAENSASFTNSIFNSPNTKYSNSSVGGDAPAALQITATQRVKFKPPRTFGWSLSDPNFAKPPVTTPGAKNWLQMFQLPLDQAYVFPCSMRQPPGNPTPRYHLRQLEPPCSPPILLANECATESTLVLPLATACSRLFAAAAARSGALAVAAANRVRSREAVYLLPPGADASRLDAQRSRALADRVDAALNDGCADVDLSVVALVLLGEEGDNGANSGCMEVPASCGVFDSVSIPAVKTSLSFQPPHSIFEESLGLGSCPLLNEDAGGQYINSLLSTGGAVADSTGQRPKEALAARFCPRILTGLDDLLPGIAGSKPNGKYVGSIRIEVQAVHTSNNAAVVDAVSTGLAGGRGSTAVEGLVELEEHLKTCDAGGDRAPVLVPAIAVTTGRRIGTFVLLLRASRSPASSPTSAAADARAPDRSPGLVALAGLDNFAEHLGIAPYLDCESPPPNSQLVASPPTAAGIRRRQVATMGSFVSPKFLEFQANVRERDADILKERYNAYYKALLSGVPSTSGVSFDGCVLDDEADVPLFKRRSPRPFRPSNSRDNQMLAGIGFNCHVQSLSINILQEIGDHPRNQGVTQSVTHGAPADHARGFGGPSSEEAELSSTSVGVGDSLKNSAPRGGLRRLESKRAEMAKELDDAITGLISAVGDHFKSRAQVAANQPSNRKKISRHIPPSNPAIVHYRNKSMELTKCLHSLTWDIAIRRANCFSQALGIAVTSYLASLSDGGPACSRGFGPVWAKHGYLLVFEGLLSSVGKELGMIEDASVAISMLRMVSVVLVPDSNSKSHPNSNTIHHIPVAHSPYLRWVHLTTQPRMQQHSGRQSKFHYRLEIGLDTLYYLSRVPEPIRNAPIRFFPILFQMGVDIRQWGVNAGRSVAMIQMKDKSKGADFIGDTNTEANETEPTGRDILDDGDDEDDGDNTTDNEILMVLNVEGYRKLNAYAHSASPTTAGVTPTSAPPPVFDVLEQTSTQVPQLPIHPSLVSLSDAIRTSVGKMEHAVLDRAATACQRLGGGSTVFCKSGKDRTAMQVTFKQAQFVQRFINRTDDSCLVEDTPISYEEVFAKSGLMRKHGNRIPICEKNAGEPKFAFNPLQRKFMPEMLRPEAGLCTWSKPET